MRIPGEDHLRAERHAVIETLESLTDAEFESGTTLCDEWAPRDILAHLMGLDTGLFEYVKAKGNVSKANAALVTNARPQSRARIMNRGRHWALHPAPHVRLTAYIFLGDLAMHHQDIVRGLGRSRAVDPACSAAILREGMTLGAKKLLTNHIVPTDGGPSVGRGPTVTGTSEALGMWLAGREGLDDELTFA